MSELLIGIQSMYKRFMKNIVFLAFLYILPFQVLLFFVSEVVSYTPTVYTELILGAFYLMFLLLQIPFIFLSNLPDDESISNREILEMVVQKFSSVYLLGLVFSLCVAIGLHFSIIPGIVIMVLGFFTPCIMVLETKPKPNMVKVIITLGLSRFLSPFHSFVSFLSYISLLNGSS